MPEALEERGCFLSKLAGNRGSREAGPVRAIASILLFPFLIIALMIGIPLYQAWPQSQQVFGSFGKIGIGTGTPEHNLDVIGDGRVSTALTVGQVLNIGKTSSLPAAPGAGTLALIVEAGTNPGTCKIVAVAGTSATPVTIFDNIGLGC